MQYSFHPKAKRSNTTDHAFEFFAQEILHILHLFIFIGCAFAFHRCTLAITAMLAFLFHLLINNNLILQRLKKQTMHHYIRVPSYRRSEMTIMLKTKTVMPHVL